MVEGKEIVTIFEVRKINDNLEELIPVDVVAGKYIEGENMFEDDYGIKYKHIEKVDYPESGFAMRIHFNGSENIDFDQFVPSQLDCCKCFNYLRYSSNLDKIFVAAPGEDFEPLNDIDGAYGFTHDNEKKMPLPSVVESKVKETIKGQDEAIRKIVTSLWMTKNFPNITKRNMLVIGPTGTGKTAIFSKLQKVLDIPLTIFATPGLSQAGYTGRSTDELLKQIYFDCNEDRALINEAIVVLDEIDKIAYDGSNSGEISTLGVQNELLKIIEGVNRTVELSNGDFFKIDTSNIIFIGTGAFSELYNKTNSKIGFNTPGDSKVDEIDSKKLTKYGMKKELLRRLPIVIELNAMTKEILKDIMLNGDESELTNILSSLYSLGITVRNIDEVIDIIAEDALNKEIGASGLVSTINEIFFEIFYQVANNPGEYKEVVIGKNIINDNTDFELISKRQKKKTKIMAQK